MGNLYQRYFLLHGAITILLLAVTSDAGIADDPTVVSVHKGHRVVLPCEMSHPDPNPPPYVIEWVRQGHHLPVFIKIGKYPPHIDPKFKALSYESLAKRVNFETEGRMRVNPGKANLIIDRVEEPDEGWYECLVIFLDENNGESDDNNLDEERAPNGTWVKLTVTSPPAFKSTPAATVTAKVGESLLLRCRAVGRPLPVISWKKDNWPVTNGQDGIRLSDGELAVTSLEKHHKGSYTCVARNDEGQIQHTTSVHIKGAPVFTSPPQNSTVKEGQGAMFSCRAEGYPTEIIYSWLYNGEPVSSSSAIRGRHQVSENGSTLTIYNVEASDQGTVTCRASNGYGTPPAFSANLVVQFPALVKGMPSIRYAGLGLQTVLVCPTVAEPRVSTVTWRKDNQILHFGPTTRYSYGANKSLLIDDVNESDAGRYTCTPYNILGTQGESTETRLIIRNPSYFTLPPNRKYEAEIGKELVVPCQGAGDPPPHVFWTKLNDEQKPEKPNVDGKRVSWKNGNLTIRSVTKNDYGRWECVLSNAVASVKSSVMIYVKYTTPHSVSAISIETSVHNAQVSWEPGYDGGYTQHFMIWYKRADKGDHSWETQSVESYRQVVTINNLEADTIYQFAILPENVLGSGRFSKTVTAKTKELPPPLPTVEQETVPPPSRLRYRIDQESGVLILMWQPPLQGRKEDLLGYIIEYRRFLKAETEDDDEPDTVSEEEPAISVPLHRSKRSSATIAKRDFAIERFHLYFRLHSKETSARRLPGLLRKKRDVDSDSESIADPDTTKKVWTSWSNLHAVPANETTYAVPRNKLHRDQVYEFHVLTVSKLAYSAPSASISVSTGNSSAYTELVLLAPDPLVSAKSPAIIAGMVTAILFCFVVVILSLLWCHRRRQCKTDMNTSGFTFGRVVDEKFDSKPRSKSESPSHRSVDSKSSGKVRDEKQGPFAKLKKKMLKVDLDTGHAYSTTNELVGLGRKVSSSSKSPLQPASDPKDHSVIRKISRAPDGKFHMSDDSSTRSVAVAYTDECDSLITTERPDTIELSPTKASLKSVGPRSHSLEWDPRSPLLASVAMGASRATPHESESLEIDCSQSDIEVRYVKDARGGNRWPSSSVSSLPGPKQYNLNRRQTEPYASPHDSSVADSTFVSQREHELGNYSTVSPYAQYVHFRDLATLRNPGTPRRHQQHSEYRVSSPPRFSDYNPTPASPSKNRYHKHTDQPGGHYHVSPRSSFTNPADRLVYEPGFARVDPIYEVGPYSPAHCPHRHSSVVTEPRRQAHNPYFNPYQPQRHSFVNSDTPTGSRQSSVIPVWRTNQSGSKYHTLTSHAGRSTTNIPNNELGPREDNIQSSSSHGNIHSIETSLRKHQENALSRHQSFPSHQSRARIEPDFATAPCNTGSLGRSHKSKNSDPEHLESRRRLVCSVDDLSVDRDHVTSASDFSERAGSLDVLDQRRSRLSVDDNSERVKTISQGRKQDNIEDDGEASPDCRAAQENTEVDHQVLSRVIHSPTSNHDDSSTISSSLPSARDAVSQNDHHQQTEVASSGYDSHNTSHTSDSPPPGTTLNPSTQPPFHCHVRTSTASSSDRSRKDTSSVDEKYEWDSEVAMESEILEALRHFGTHNRTGSVSRALIDEIQKLGMDRDIDMETTDVDISNDAASLSAENMYTKESMERRCAALKKEYQRYQREQQSKTQLNLNSVKENTSFNKDAANALTQHTNA